jgi:Flp pilus assembly protein TadG
VSRLRRPPTRGQSLVEFALVLPVFLVILFGIVDAGRLVYMNSVLSQAAREGARLGSVEASWMTSTNPGCGAAGGPVCPATVAELRSHITAASNRMLAPFSAVENVYTRCDAAAGTPPTGAWTASTCASRNPGDRMSVRVTHTFRALTPGIANLIGPTTLSASSTMVIN